MIYEYMRKLKDERKRTNQQIADMSGVPLSTVHRILSGATDSPNIQNVIDIVKALEGSLDEMAGIKPKSVPVDNSQIEVYKQIIADKNELIADKNALIVDKNHEIEKKEKWILRLAIVIGVLVGFFIFMLVLDRMNGDIGYIRY